jgi:predicted Zn-dependent peptidase
MDYQRITVKSDLLGEEYTKIKHKSGLDIYVFPKELTTSYCLIATRFGSVDNTFRLQGEEEFVTVPDGVAHFLEHKMFENEDGEDTFVKFSRTGANANAYTSTRVTAYLFSCTEELCPSLVILLKSVFSPYFTEENVKKEQGIIAQEIRQGEDNPYNAVLYGMLEGLYEKNSVRISIAGTVPSIMQITPETLYRCHKAFYNPANMALCVCGQAEVEEVLRVADEVLSDIAPVKVESKSVTEGKKAFQTRVEKKMQVAKPLVCIGVKDVDISSDPEERVRRSLAMNVIEELCFGKTSRLYNELYDEGLISPSFGCWHAHTPQFSFFSASSDTDEPDILAQRMKDYTVSDIFEAVNEENLERCRRVMYSDFVKSFDSTDEIANVLITDFALDGAEMFRFYEHINSLTVDYVKGVIRELFTPEAFTVSVVMPI